MTRPRECSAIGCAACPGRVDCEMLAAYASIYGPGYHPEARGNLDVWFPRAAKPEPPPDLRDFTARMEDIHAGWADGSLAARLDAKAAQRERARQFWRG